MPDAKKSYETSLVLPTSNILALIALLLISLSALSDEATCPDQEVLISAADDVRVLINASKACETDNDCTTAYFSCPFSCGTVINKKHELHISEAVKAYHDKFTCSRCKARCRAINKAVQCIEKQCKYSAKAPSP